jgi:hypothetical protein
MNSGMGRRFPEKKIKCDIKTIKIKEKEILDFEICRTLFFV